MNQIKKWDKVRPLIKNNELGSLAKNVRRVWNPWGSQVDMTNIDKSLEDLVEQPLRKAVKILWSKSIKTNCSDVWNAVNYNPDGVQQYATIGISTFLLSPHNLSVFEEFKQSGMISGKDCLSFPVSPDTKISKIESFFVKQVSKFEKQGPGDFTEEQIFDMFSSCYRLPSKVLKLVSTSEDKYQQLSALDIIDREKTALVFGSNDITAIIEHLKTSNATVKDFTELLKSKYPEKDWHYADIFYEIKDPEKVENSFQNYKTREFPAKF